MNKLDYSVSLRAKGLSKTEIIKEMKVNGFDESEIDYYLRKSDDIYLNQLLNNKRSNNKQSKPQTASNRVLKTVVLIISLLLLIAVFYGYARIGLIGLFIFWSLIKFSSYRR